MKRSGMCVLLAVGIGTLGTTRPTCAATDEENPFQRAEIAYRGKISAVDANPISEHTPIPMVFRLYDGETSRTVLWGRKLSVAMKPNGTFSVKLGDKTGTAVTGATYDTLADALVAAADPCIGLAPGSSSDGDASLEFKTRQRLVSVPAVQRAQLARTSDTLNVATLVCGALVAETVLATNAVVRADDTLLASTDVRLRLDGTGADNVFRVDGASLAFTRFAPPMTEMKPFADVGDLGKATAIAICADDAESDVKAVCNEILLPGQQPTAGRDVMMAQKFGEGE